MKKVGEFKGKPIVEGNPNQIKNNQIHYSNKGGGEQSYLKERMGS